MADPFSSAESYPLRLAVEMVGEGVFELNLDDDAGHSGGGELTLALDRPLGVGFATWSDFLLSFVEYEPSQDALAHFGRDLFRAIFAELPRLRDAFQGIQGRAGTRALMLTLELGPRTERFAALPFELLHDGTGFVFARPASALRRTYSELEQKSFELPAEPRILFAWACPPGSGSHFDPEPHAEALQKLFGSRVERCDAATREGLRARLKAAQAEADPFHYVHILAHGYRDVAVAGICLGREDGQLDFVEAQVLGQMLAHRGVQLAFLCSCKTAVSGAEAFSGVGQQLLAPRGGDLPCVVATQANLPVARSAELCERFYRNLAQSGEPSAALVAARRQAYDVGGFGWSVPILLSRPTPPALRDLQIGVAGVPTRRATYLPRPELEEKILEALRKSRLVSVVGLPGIGKTEVGGEAARRAVVTGLFDRAIYREARAGMNAADLRRLLGVALGQEGAPEDDEELSLLFAAKAERLLLVLDNAEDLMRTLESQRAFRDQLDTLLGGAPKLKILLTTRWLVGTTRESEHEVDVEPLPKKQMASLLEKELRSQGYYQESWPQSPAWEKLLALLDGHPRTLWLITRQLTGKSASLERVVARLDKLKENAAVDADLLGRADIWDVLADDKKARLRSLVAGMDFSFEVLAERHPQAVEVFLALSLFPAGLPDSVARAVAGEEGQEALEQLYNYHLAQWQAARIFYPVPLHWYAERRRREFPVDEAHYRRRALEGFVPFVQACHYRMVSGALLKGLDAFLKEVPTLDALVLQGTLSPDQGQVATLASASVNAILYANLHDFGLSLLRAGISAAIKNSDRLGEANCRWGLGHLQKHLGEPTNARTSYSEALTAYREVQDPQGEANCLQCLGDLLMQLGEMKEAEQHLQHALPLFRSIDDHLGEGTCLNSLGQFYLWMRDLNAAHDFTSNAMLASQRAGSKLAFANALAHLGAISAAHERPVEALDFYERALAEFCELRALTGEATCRSSIGQLLLGTHPQVAYEHLRYALKIQTACRDLLDSANTLKTLGELSLRFGDLDSAATYLYQALPLFRQFGIRSGAAHCLAAIGDLKLRLGKFQEARAAIQEALSIFRDIEEGRGVAICLCRIGDLEIHEGRPNEAIEALKNALPIFENACDSKGIQLCFGLLAKANDSEGRLDQALLLSEAALVTGRKIDDYFGQVVTLGLQIGIWRSAARDPLPFLGAILLHRSIGLQLKDARISDGFSTVLAQLMPQLEPELRQALEGNPEAFRQAGIAEARERFAASGLELFSPLQERTG